MSATRRASLQDSRDKLGDPYQIYTEVVNAGKTVTGTKKKVRWLFGFSNSNQEYEVILVISLLSGKKVIYEEGKEVVTTTSMLNTDFAHGWSSLSTRRLFRVEANLTINGDLAFIFSVDGVPYIDFPHKHEVKRQTSHLAGGRYGDEASEPQSGSFATRRASTGSAPVSSHRAPVESSTFGTKPATAQVTKTTVDTSSFDPFAAGNSESFDPFGEDFSSSSSAPVSGHHSGNVAHKPASAASIAKPPAATTKTTPTAGARRPSFSPKSAAVSLFDEVPESQTAAKPSNDGFDAFGDSSDPFGASSTSTDAFPAPVKSSSAAGFDPFGPSHDSHPHTSKTASPAVPVATTTSAAAFDPFDSHPVAPPHPPSAASAAAKNPPVRRGSALDDLAGLSYGPPSGTMNVTRTFVSGTSTTSTNASSQPESAASAAFESDADTTSAGAAAANAAANGQSKSAVKDPWQTNLVDLDLSGKNRENVRRSSVQQGGPSLNQLMQGTSIGSNNNRNGVPPGSTAAAAAGSSSYNNSSNNNIMGLSNNDPFGAPTLLQATPSGNTGFSSNLTSQPSFNDSFAPSTSNYGNGMAMGHNNMSNNNAFNNASNNNLRGSMTMGNNINGMPPSGNTMMGGNSGVSRPTGNPGMSGGSNVMGGGVGRSSFIMGPNAGMGGVNGGVNPNNAQKSSLDSLDWRAMG